MYDPETVEKVVMTTILFYIETAQP
jgi:hypothetical protein